MESGLRVMNKANALTILAQFKDARNASHTTPATPTPDESHRSRIPWLERAIPAV